MPFRRLKALSDTDLQILENMKSTAEMLGVLLGDCCECVLHAFSNLERSVIYIHNGRLTDRDIGSPVTDKALEILHTAESTGQRVIGPYLTRGSDGRMMKSCTMTVMNNETPPRIIGMLCLNIDLDVPFSTIIKVFSAPTSSSSDAETDSKESSGRLLPGDEYFARDVSDLIANTVAGVKAQVMADESIGLRRKTAAIIGILHNKGLFRMRDSVNEVASHLNVTRDTVYMHLRALEKKGSS